MRIRSIKPEFWRSQDIEPNDIQAFKSFGESGYQHEFLYLLRDKDGHLLYVGITWNPFVRWRAHRAKHAWWPEVAHAEVWRCVDSDARYWETRCIKELEPIHNKHQNRRWHQRGKDQDDKA